MADVEFEKTPFASKKFSAFFAITVTLELSQLVMLLTIADDLGVLPWSLMLAVVLTQGCVAMMYLGGQAGVDSYVRVASLLVGAGKPPALKKGHQEALSGLLPAPEPETADDEGEWLDGDEGAESGDYEEDDDEV